MEASTVGGGSQRAGGRVREADTVMQANYDARAGRTIELLLGIALQRRSRPEPCGEQAASLTAQRLALDLELATSFGGRLADDAIEVT